MRPATIDELERWEERGAVWHPLELTNQRVVVELCTCHGEPVDLVHSEDAELIAFVRSRRGA
jgi:hypothetical protein